MMHPLGTSLNQLCHKSQHKDTHGAIDTVRVAEAATTTRLSAMIKHEPVIEEECKFWAAIHLLLSAFQALLICMWTLNG